MTSYVIEFDFDLDSTGYERGTTMLVVNADNFQDACHLVEESYPNASDFVDKS